MIPNSDRPSGTPTWKPERGTALKERRTKRKTVRDHETDEKREVRLRDRKCRWPHCSNCRKWKPRLEVAHLDPKGQGGDHGVRTSADRMILLDYLTHQGADGLERHERKIEPLTKRGTNGPCAFFVKVWSETRKGESRWRCVGRERSIGILEHAQ